MIYNVENIKAYWCKIDVKYLIFLFGLIIVAFITLSGFRKEQCIQALLPRQLLKVAMCALVILYPLVNPTQWEKPVPQHLHCSFASSWDFPTGKGFALPRLLQPCVVGMIPVKTSLPQSEEWVGWDLRAGKKSAEWSNQWSRSPLSLLSFP